MLAHAATREGIVAVNNMFGKKDRIRYNAIPAVIYTHPEVASVGRTEEELKALGIEYKKSVVPMAVAGRFLVENEGGTGMVKVLAGARYGEILGVHAIGDASSEFIIAAAAMIETEMCVSDVSEIVFPHPTVSEALREAILRSPSLGVRRNAQVDRHRTGKSICQGHHPFVRHSGERLSARPAEEELAAYSRRGVPDHLAGHVRDPASSRRSSTRSRPRARYKGVAYNHAGPAHLSIGQEAAAVGMAFSLTPDDHIFGSHRSHGEILAKGFSAIRQLSDAQLLEIMESYRDGAMLRPGREGIPGDGEGPGPAVLHLRRLQRDLRARDRLQPRAGRLHARLLRAVRDLSQQRHRGRLRLHRARARRSSSGSTASRASWCATSATPPSAAVRCGKASPSPPWTSTASCGTQSLGGGLPIIFNCMNNFYGMGGQPFGETMGVQFIARIGAGVNPEQMHAERVNGYDPLPVIDAFRRKKQVLAEGRGPVLLDTVTYRISGHSPSDASSYRSKEEIEHWQQADSIRAFRAQADRRAERSPRTRWTTRQGAHRERRCSRCSGWPPIWRPARAWQPDSELVGSVMFSNRRVEKFDDRQPEFLQDLVAESHGCSRSAARSARATQDGKPVPKMKVYNIRDGIFEAMLHRFAIDPTMVAFGEENRDWGGAFAVYRGLTEALPYHRLFNSPISEAAIVGAAVGYALEGGRVVAELMYADFMGRAGDEIFNQLSKWQAMSAGQLTMPVVLRISVGAKYGAQHSQDWTALVAPHSRA